MRKYLLIAVFSLLFLPFAYASAQPGGSAAIPASGPGASGVIPCDGTTGTCIANPINVSSPQALIGRVINVVLGVVGSLALIMFILGGVTWMTSAGSPEKIKKGREILVWAAVGLVIIFSSYALVNFVIRGIAQ